MKQHTHPVRRFLRTVETSITIGEIAETELWFVEPFWSGDQARQEMEDRNFDVAPVRGNPISHCLHRADIRESNVTVDAFARPLDATHLVTFTLGLVEGILLLSDRRFLFVLEGSRVAGIITLADCQKPPVSMATLGLILAAESALSKLIERNYGNEEAWFEVLTDNRRTKIAEVYNERQRHNAEITRIECLSLEDRLLLVRKREDLRTDLGFKSGSAFQKWEATMKNLRDPIAHGGSILTACPDPLAAIRLLRQVRDFAERAVGLAFS